jgi:hypothetical protein
MRLSLFQICACAFAVLMSTDVAARALVINSEAEAFIRVGAVTSLKGCDLSRNTCGASRLIVVEHGSGESGHSCQVLP